MKKLEILITKEISNFEALKQCEKGYHKFKYSFNRLTCNRCGFDVQIPLDDFKSNYNRSYWYKIAENKEEEAIQSLKEKLFPFIKEAGIIDALINPKNKTEELVAAALNLLESPIMPILVEFEKRCDSIRIIKDNCCLNKHSLTFEDPQFGTLKEGEIVTYIKQSKGIWCKHCGILIYPLSGARWKSFKEEPLERIKSERIRIRNTLQRYFKKLDEFNWITLVEKQKFQALILSYTLEKQKELLEFFAETNEKTLRIQFFLINLTKEQISQMIQETKNMHERVLKKLMQKTNSPEELKKICCLDELKKQQTILGKKLTALDKLYLLGSCFKWDELEKTRWENKIVIIIKTLKDQQKKLQIQKETIIYPDTKEYFNIF